MQVGWNDGSLACLRYLLYMFYHEMFTPIWHLACAHPFGRKIYFRYELKISYLMRMSLEPSPRGDSQELRILSSTPWSLKFFTAPSTLNMTTILFLDKNEDSYSYLLSRSPIFQC